MKLLSVLPLQKLTLLFANTNITAETNTKTNICFRKKKLNSVVLKKPKKKFCMRFYSMKLNVFNSLS